MKRLVYSLIFLVGGFAAYGNASADEPGIPPWAFFDTDDDGFVDGSADSLNIIANFGVTGVDNRTDLNFDGVVDILDFAKFDDYRTTYDANGDNFVDIVDANVVHAHVAGGGGYVAAYDINEDMQVTALDALMIINSIGQSPWNNQRPEPWGPGDVNDNGVFDVQDAVDLGTYLVGVTDGSPPIFGKCRAPFYDVNGDKLVDLDDLKALVNEL